MKVLISTDIEGVAGVVHHQQVRAGNPEYDRARLLMTHEANAAIAGAFDAAQAVFVQTKRATGQTSGISLSPAAAREAIRAGVSAALRPPRPEPYVLRTPLQVRIQTRTPALADLFCQWPTLQRLAADAIGFDAPTVEAAVRIVNCLSAMSTVLR